MKRIITGVAASLAAAVGAAPVSPESASGEAVFAAASGEAEILTLEALANGEGRSRMLSRWDADSDGVVRMEEIPEERRDRFEGADLNADGILSSEEFSANWQSRRLNPGEGENAGGRLMERFDANGDGQLQLSELSERQRERLQGADADSNGSITQAELDAHREQDRGRGPVGRFTPERMIERLDADGDGTLRIDEIPEARRGMFEGADTDSDGTLSLTEIQAHMQRNGGRGEGRGNRRSQLPRGEPGPDGELPGGPPRPDMLPDSVPAESVTPPPRF